MLAETLHGLQAIIGETAAAQHRRSGFSWQGRPSAIDARLTALQKVHLRLGKTCLCFDTSQRDFLGRRALPAARIEGSADGGAPDIMLNEHNA